MLSRKLTDHQHEDALWPYKEYRNARKSETAGRVRRRLSKRRRQWLASDLRDAVEAWETPDLEEFWRDWEEQDDYDPFDLEDEFWGFWEEEPCPVCGLGKCTMD